MKLPERHVELGLKIGADSIDSLCDHLVKIASEIRHRKSISCISGGSDCGYTAHMKINSETTHETFFEELEKWTEWDANRGRSDG